MFTALEYVAFATAGVGTWQARLVPAFSGLAAVAFIMAGLTSIVSRRTALLAGALLAANYGFVMWNRAALMESTMTTWIVGAWAAYALGARRPAWGLAAGAAACAAWFTKASAAFFVAALALDALILLAPGGKRSISGVRPGERRLGAMVLLGLALSFAAALVLFVVPHWHEYRFYNWQMSVTRKPDYSAGAFIDRATWLPVVQSLFSRMWIELVAAALALLAIATRWRTSSAGERLLVLWILVGLAELVVHDSGNERRYVMFIPAVVALAAIFVDRALARPEHPVVPLAPPQASATVLVPLVLLTSYLAAGSAARVVLLEQVEAGSLSAAVRIAAGCAVLLAAAAAVWRVRLLAWLAAPRMPAGLIVSLAALAMAGQLFQLGLWSRRRATFNHDASVAIGRLLPPGTLVQGKLANGLSLENRIRPIFVGNGFGNYDDRLRRDDVRYILTYDLPRVGFESSDGSGLIPGILAHYPGRRTVETFVVDETPVPDRAALIDKFSADVPVHARD
ncbi:MAG: glycosyltransferase family 39 protein [Acidobacteria bacterium]|nr:glycosyltransferase family 39 protein [Acidobacteriota bacterium]